MPIIDQAVKDHEILFIVGKHHGMAKYGPMLKISKYIIHKKLAGWFFNKTTFNDEYPDLENKINGVILRLFEGGIHNKLFHYYMHQLDLTHVDDMEIESNEPKPYCCGREG